MIGFNAYVKLTKFTFILINKQFKLFYKRTMQYFESGNKQNF